MVGDSCQWLLEANVVPMNTNAACKISTLLLTLSLNFLCFFKSVVYVQCYVAALLTMWSIKTTETTTFKTRNEDVWLLTTQGTSWVKSGLKTDCDMFVIEKKKTKRKRYNRKNYMLFFLFFNTNTNTYTCYCERRGTKRMPCPSYSDPNRPTPWKLSE